MKRKKLKLSYRFNNPKNSWVVEEDIVHVLHDGQTLVIATGFVTDGSSVPWYLKWLLPSVGDFFLAAIVHDYLYNIDKSRGKKFADKEMLIISKEYNNRNVFKLIDNYLRYAAVVVGGKNSWNN